MKQPFVAALILAASLGGAVTSAPAQRADILPTARREPTVDLAAALAYRAQPEPLPAELNNPFFPDNLKPKVVPVENTDRAVVPMVVAPVGDYSVLEAVAPSINPTGSVNLGGRALLLFGQKKISVGDELDIMYQGVRYTLIVSAIQSSHFTLKLGEAEFTRPIKSTN